MDINRDGGVKVKEVCEQFIRKLRRKNLQKTHRTKVLPNLKCASFLKAKGRWGNIILCGLSCIGDIAPLKPKLLQAVRVHLGM
jgi:hypothetical protein